MIKLLVNILIVVIDFLYRNRPIARFYVLETVARVPYFAYVSVLHLYESLGSWRKADWLKVHFAESWNELHHLLIMEELGANKHFIDRLIAKIGALVYYWVVVLMYLLNPEAAYRFMELVETHALDTYGDYLKQYEAELKQKPAPQVALNYYRDGDLYMFDAFQIANQFCIRRPVIENLYDVFVAIRDDENEHVKTMIACQQPDAQQTLMSPHTVRAILSSSQKAEVKLVAKNLEDLSVERMSKK